MQKTNVSKSRLLTNDKPIIVLSSLVDAFDFNCAMILQQIFYWMTINKEKNNYNINDSIWVRITIKEICDQLNISETSVKRSVKKLENEKVLITCNYNKWKNDNTKWYTINFEVLGTIVHLSPGCFEIFDKAKMNQALQESSNRYNEEESNVMDISNRDIPIVNETIDREYGKTKNKTILNFISLYCSKIYMSKKKVKHPFIAKESVDRVYESLLDFSINYLGLVNSGESAVDEDVLDYLVLMSEAFFRNVHQSDHNIIHFSESSILVNRFYEIGIY